MALCAGAEGGDGSAPLTVASDSYAGVQVELNIGFYCVKIDAAGSDGHLYCDAGTPVDVDYSIDSHGAGANDPPVSMMGGNPGPAGSAYLTATVRAVLCPGAPACIGTVASTADCADPTKVDFSQVDPTTLPLTTGAVTARIINPAPDSIPMGTGDKTTMHAGEPFDCANWQIEDGPGTLVIPFLLTDAQFGIVHVGDAANVIVLDD